MLIVVIICIILKFRLAAFSHRLYPEIAANDRKYLACCRRSRPRENKQKSECVDDNVRGVNCAYRQLVSKCLGDLAFFVCDRRLRLDDAHRRLFFACASKR